MVRVSLVLSGEEVVKRPEHEKRKRRKNSDREKKKKKKSDEQNDGHVEKFNETGSTRRVQPSGFNKMKRKM